MGSPRNRGTLTSAAVRPRIAKPPIAAAVAILAVVAACSRAYVRAPDAGVPGGDGGEISVTYLIGDFGKPAEPFRDLVTGIAADVARLEGRGLRTTPTILELGDNLYEDGLPRDLDLPGARDEVGKLLAVGAAFADVRYEGSQVPIAVIPGNHDYADDALTMSGNLGDISRWYFLDELGVEGATAWTHVPGDASGFTTAAELLDHIDGDPSAHAEFMAPLRVPHTDPGLWIVAIDSELILDLYAQGHEELVATYWRQLDRAMERAPEGVWRIVASHHPAVTYGKHGEPSFGNWVFGQGYPQFPYAWQKALAVSLPLGIILGVVVHPAAVVLAAVPPATTAIVSGRKQDIGSEPYDRYAAALLDHAERHDVDVLVSGHDHNTQIIELRALAGYEGDTLMVVTGAGSKVDPVRRGPGTVAYLADYSWVRMRQLADGLSFAIVDRSGTERYRHDLSR